MELCLKRLGNYIKEVDDRNKDGAVLELLGVSITKEFIPSVANTVGTDLAKYKIIRKGQFACSLMQVSRDGGVAIALHKSDTPAIMSPAYFIFEVNNSELIAEYLELIFESAEFDREAVFYAIGGVRGTLSWDGFCNMQINVPKIEAQNEIVRQNIIIKNRIKILNDQNICLNKNAQSLLIHQIQENACAKFSLGDIVEFIDGDRGKNYPTFEDFYDKGYCLFLNASNVTASGFNFDSCQFITKEKDEILNSGHLSYNDIIITTRGTLGNVAFYDETIPYQNVRINSGMLIVRPHDENYSPILLYFLFKSVLMKQIIISLRSGSAQPQIPIKDFRFAKFHLPISNNILNDLSQKLFIIYKVCAQNSLEIMKLKRLNNIILSKL